MQGAARTSVDLCFYQWGDCLKAESGTQTAFVECPSTLFRLHILGFILEKTLKKKTPDRNNPHWSLIGCSDRLDLLFKVDLPLQPLKLRRADPGDNSSPRGGGLVLFLWIKRFPEESFGPAPFPR